jgi:hypothetical protein
MRPILASKVLVKEFGSAICSLSSPWMMTYLLAPRVKNCLGTSTVAGVSFCGRNKEEVPLFNNKGLFDAPLRQEAFITQLSRVSTLDYDEPISNIPFGVKVAI